MTLPRRPATVATLAMPETTASVVHGMYHGDVLRRRHPRIQLRLQAALVAAREAQRLVMAGGGTSWLDLGLYLIARVSTVQTAMDVARVNLIDWHDVGYEDAGFFGRLFRRNVGLTPAQYRKRFRTLNRALEHGPASR